eukprot:Partr_v1_DN26316_c0_g1_i2_m43322 putative 6-pyruvoyl tetrahydrobiopterin synthase
MTIAFIRRTAQFSAAHRLNSPKLSVEENRIVYGKCNHINGHGHNYDVSVTIRGPIDPTTGMVINIVVLRDALEAVVMDRLDHKNLDMDVDFFSSTPSTTENVCLYIWTEMKRYLCTAGRLPPGADLFEVAINETSKNS